MSKELEVFITSDGLGRAAIVQRNDAVLCIYVHWLFSDAAMAAAGINGSSPRNWWTDPIAPERLYAEKEPEQGLYNHLDDARRQVKSLPGFSEAKLKLLEKQR